LAYRLRRNYFFCEIYCSLLTTKVRLQRYNVAAPGNDDLS